MAVLQAPWGGRSLALFCIVLSTHHEIPQLFSLRESGPHGQPRAQDLQVLHGITSGLDP